MSTSNKSRKKGAEKSASFFSILSAIFVGVRKKNSLTDIAVSVANLQFEIFKIKSRQKIYKEIENTFAEINNNNLMMTRKMSSFTRRLATMRNERLTQKLESLIRKL